MCIGKLEIHISVINEVAMKYDAKCDMNCFECTKPDCTKNRTLTREERISIQRWLPSEAKERPRKKGKDNVINADKA